MLADYNPSTLHHKPLANVVAESRDNCYTMRSSLTRSDSALWLHQSLPNAAVHRRSNTNPALSSVSGPVNMPKA